MRIGFVWNSPSRLGDSSIRYERYVRGFRELGHEVLVVATRGNEEGFPESIHAVPNRDTLQQSSLWSGLGLDAALIPSWLGMSTLLAVMRPHVRLLISLTDSDGCTGVRVFPREMLKRMWVMHSRLPDRLRAAGWWLRQFLWTYPKVDREVLESSRLVDRLVVYSPGAKTNLQSFFDYHQEPNLGNRIIYSPYPVDDAFDREPMSPHRTNQIVAIGRWGDPQKDSQLLVGAIRLYLDKGGQGAFILVGSEGTNWFRPLETAYPGRVEYRGVVSPPDVAHLLSTSRMLLSTSRWESGPIVASEALLRGCTLVGPDSIPGFRQLCQGGACGTTFKFRTAKAVSKSLIDEGELWAKGRRNSQTIADAWKGRFSAVAICRQLLANLT